MSTSVGAIDLGLKLNKNDFGRELNGIGKYAEGQAKSSFAGVGKVLGSVIAVGSVVAFAKSCIDLGSDLQEVQNVVDVTFGSMSNDINTFAKNAIRQFGLSETSAKQYSSTMGAMLKSMGFTTKEALKMSKSITGLSADMASFYNLDNQTAFEKIRSGISGETEPLKQLGINMSVANLEAYALSQGIKTAYNSMTQQQQALLRYNYLMSVTADAQGDFARTSGGWANQVRILKENFNSFKAELGQAFIAVATPVVACLNSIITKFVQATSAFRQFVDAITGNTNGESSVGNLAADLSATKSGAEAANNAVGNIGKSAEKTKKALMGFDEINILNLGDDEEAGAGISATTPTSSANANVVGQSMSGISAELNKVLDDFKSKYNELQTLFKNGLNIGIGGNHKQRIAGIKNDLLGIKKSLADIFNDSKVKAAANNLIKNFAFALGQINGAGISIGTTVAQNLVGGFDKYLKQSKGFITDRITSIFNSASRTALQAGSFATAFADVFSVFGGETGQQITANIIGIFNDSFLGLTDLGLQFGSGLFWSVTQPFIDNKEEFKKAVENTLKPIETITGTFKQSVDDTFTAAQKTFDEHINPMFDNFEEGTSRMAKAMLDWYNNDMSPVLDGLAADWSKMYKESVQPNIDECIKIVGKFGEIISLVWKNIITPFVEWYSQNFGQHIANGTEMAGKFIIAFADKAGKGLAIVHKGYNLILDDIINFLKSLENFEENWSAGMDKIINGLKGDTIKNVLKQLGTDIKQITKNSINGVIDNINQFIKGINAKLKIELPEILGGETIDFNVPTIPKLARGGIVKQPTLAMVGEAGREAVMPLENNTGWIDELAGKIAMLIMSQGNSGSNTYYDNTPIEIEIVIGGVKFGKAVLDSLNALKKQNGKLKLEF